MNEGRSYRGITYGIVILAVVGVLCIFVLNLDTSDSALKVSYIATSTVSDTSAPSNPRIIRSGSMTFELSTSTEQQEQGLSDRPTVSDNYGMLFAFPKPASVGFWMKDMMVPLDIIWLSDKGAVLGIEASLATSTYPNAVYPPVPVRYVLETKSGFMAAHGIKVGDAFPNLSPILASLPSSF